MLTPEKNIARPDLLVITGPTASGKTRFAAELAFRVGGEIISADSRQVYRGMDLGTGKDLDDYQVSGVNIPYHLIDIADPGEPYNVYNYQQDVFQAIEHINQRNNLPILCGGSGLYIEAVIRGYRLIEVPPDDEFRAEAAQRSNEDLITELGSLVALHNKSDTDNRKRLIRALEIARYYNKNPLRSDESPILDYKIIGIRFDRTTERTRITNRLKERLEQGMPEEVRSLADRYGWEKMEYFGLEYKWISYYLKGEISYEEMFNKLNTAIHQFAKRQMTWFRRMERSGLKIFWIEGDISSGDKIEHALAYLEST